MDVCGCFCPPGHGWGPQAELTPFPGTAPTPPGRGTLLTLQGVGRAAGLYGPASEVPSIASAVFLGLYRAARGHRGRGPHRCESCWVGLASGAASFGERLHSAYFLLGTFFKLSDTHYARLHTYET